MKKDESIPTLRRFKEMNRDRYEIIRIGVFGSAARDSMNEQSDIDVSGKRKEIFLREGLRFGRTILVFSLTYSWKSVILKIDFR